MMSPDHYHGQPGRSPLYPPLPSQHGTLPQNIPAPAGPSSSPLQPRMDTSFSLHRPVQQNMMGQPPNTTPSPQQIGPQTPPAPAQFGLSDQDLIEHAVRTTDRLMNNDFRTPSLYNSLMQAHDPHLAQAGKTS